MALDLVLRQRVNTRSFDAWVDITSGPANATVAVSLQQTRGVAPLFSDQRTAILDAQGAASVDFGSFQLSGPTRVALLLATAIDSAGITIGMDAEGTEVP